MHASSIFEREHHIASTCSTEVTLGSVMTSRPAGRRLGQRAHEQLQGARPAAARRRLEALEPNSVKWRGFSGRDRRGEGLGGSDRCGIFVFVGPDAIAVLEVDPQILDGLGVQLAADALVNFCGDVGLQVERLGQLRRGPAVGGQRLSGLLGPVPDRFRVERSAGTYTVCTG